MRLKIAPRIGKAHGVLRNLADPLAPSDLAKVETELRQDVIRWSSLEIKIRDYI